MNKKSFRFTLTVTEEIAKEAEKLKKEKYYDASYAEMYRQLILAGLEIVEKNKNNMQGGY